MIKQDIRVEIIGYLGATESGYLASKIRPRRTLGRGGLAARPRRLAERGLERANLRPRWDGPADGSEALTGNSRGFQKEAPERPERGLEMPPREGAP